jgi:hypothetical protein
MKIKYAEQDLDIVKRRKHRGENCSGEGSLNCLLSPMVDSADWDGEKTLKIKKEDKY